MENNLRFYRVNKTYGGQEFLFVNLQYEMVIEGCTRSCKNTMYSNNDTKVKTLKELKAIKERYINAGYKVMSDKDLSYKALMLLKEDNNTLSLDEMLSLKDN